MSNRIALQFPIVNRSRILTAGDRPYDKKRLDRTRHSVGQRSIRRIVGEILSAGEEPYEWPPLLGDMVADRASQHRISCFERVQNCAQRGLALDLKVHFAIDVRQRP
jgi:hypothetical protein